ncbi:ABC transporter permease [Streptomyces sp. SudanB91_2054]|uniref:ABC transporter permease n=1 Tax=Streptomyces sp. SudanB91_2054 TaxID=3035278 RepID=UPI0036DD1B30
MSGALVTPTGRIAALARAELTLFVRSKAMLASALVVPLVLPFSARSVIEDMDIEATGLSIGLILLPGSIGFSLLFAVYSTLVGVFAGRREELVLKRLRTGELRDAEILGGSALPAVTLGLVQATVLVAGCTALLDVPAPKAFPYAVLGLVLGLALSVSLALLTANLTRTTESAQVTTLPLVVVSVLGSGMAAPREMLPDALASLCELLPFSPVMTLLRGGWTGDLLLHEVLGATATAAAWVAFSVLAVHRWFRWEPRH